MARKRLPRLKALLASCRLCARECNARRFRNETGECNLTSDLLVSSAHLHFGEEPVISGNKGSGTIFFSGCNLACIFCQNYPISQFHTGKQSSPRKLSEMMLKLQLQGAHNINLVTPSPQLEGILEALIIAWEEGLKLPIVYNCGGYESVAALGLMEGLIDIYLADLKYGKDEVGTVSGIEDYFSRASIALVEMNRQVGSLSINDEGIATQGLIVRHLVLPGGQSATPEVLHFLKESIGEEVFISLMSQYYPSHRAKEHPKLGNRLSREEYKRMVNILSELGQSNGWVQPDPW
ncbi:radical SAM protein [bacterium]|nr:radical SAM protein [bacterium]